MKKNTIEDPIIGTLTLDTSARWYEGQHKVGDSNYSLIIESDENGCFDCSLESARDLVTKLDELVAEAKSYAASQLLQLKNDTWLDEDENEVSGEDFVARMTIHAITVHRDGNVELYFNDDDLFWGHFIVVQATKDRKWIDANLAG